MIPQKLQIKNFLSYGPNLQTIDFTNYGLICLSGKNGHGKSALLDAMTWALWGQARKIAGATKADQGLLRLGQTQMLVVFDFLFGGKTYRIRREYMETYGKPVNILEFGMVEAETDTFIPLTDKTIRTTQEKIEQTLRIDFESFSNSAFLRQGSSNEFSKKSPKDRKQILATILGLDQYEVIRKLAQEKIKDAQTKMTILCTLQEKRTQELTAQERLDDELATLNAHMSDIESNEKKLQKEHLTHTQQQALFDEKQKQYHNFSFQLQQLEGTADAHKTQLRDILAQWRLINKKKQSLSNIALLDQEKNKIIAAITNHQKLFQENLEHRQTLLTITQHIGTIEQQHKDEQTKKNHTLQLELERLRAEQKNHDVLISKTVEQVKQYTNTHNSGATNIADLKKALTAITQKPQDIAQAELRLEKRKTIYQQFVALGNWINSELNNCNNRKKLIHEDDPSCPLCEQNLSASRRRFLKTNFEKQESFLNHRLQRLKRIIPITKEKLVAEHAQLTKNKELIQQAQTIAAKIVEQNDAQAKLAQEITQLTETLTQQEQENIACGNAITNKQQIIDNFLNQPILIDSQQYTQLIAQKKELEQQLQKHVYNEDNYKKDQQKLVTIEAQRAEYDFLNRDIAQQENRKNDIQKLCTALKQLNTTLSTISTQRMALGDLVTQQTILQENEKNLTNQQNALKKQKEILLQTKGSIESQCAQLKKIQQEFEQEKISITQHQAVIEDYQTIATATGKDGIQALLIEEAIPEIEQEANYLLSRLTNNQAQIFIESLRDLKKGGTKETLDIKISDQAGIRPYEMFSGGEAFRIDFALRIAISKLLARRAGTALQILIIDEGFGSQDEEGLGYIMDALHKIEDDFSKIIIVSHLPSMKDQFPVQFFIEKGVQGSTVSIIEQG